MANYGFVIDLRKCIGCHACTIACKAEHQIPVGVNRCWVKTVEKGTFPDTRRFFFPVLCNQCVEAPCVRICPTNALFKRRDGIVDLNGMSCIGCRACMEACPYDQLFIDPNTRTAEKCNFCANRVENKLLPACVSVCPTECRIFGTWTMRRARWRRSCSGKRSRSANLRKVPGRRSSTSPPKKARSDPKWRPGRCISKKGRYTCGRSARRCLTRIDPDDTAGRLRRAAREALGHRHGALSALQSHLDGCHAALGALWWLGYHVAYSRRIVGPGLSIVFISADRGRARSSISSGPSASTTF